MYPSNIDEFTIKKNHTVDVNGNVLQDGDDVLAEHINTLQDSIVTIENTVGTNPQGTYATVADRLDNIAKVGLLNVPSISIYTNNPLTIDNQISKVLDIYAQYSYVFLGISAIDNAQYKASTAYALIHNSQSKYIGIVDYTTDIDVVKSYIYAWSSVGAKGVYLSTFDYTCFTRAEQNEITQYVHELDMFMVVSGDIDQILSNQYVEGKNTNYIPTSINSNDIYMIDNFACTHAVYENLNTLNTRLAKYLYYRESFNIKLWAISYIDTQKEFYYVNTAAMLYSLNAQFAAPSFTTYNKYDIIPLVGNYYTDNPAILTDGISYYRTAQCGKIILSPSGEQHIYGGKIPIDFIDSSVITIDSSNIQSLDAGVLSEGDVASARMVAHVVEAVNSASDKVNENSIGTISAVKIATAVKDVFSSQDQTFINELSVNVLHILNDLNIEGNISADRISANVISAINSYIGHAEIDSAHIGILTSDKISANVVDAINLYAGTATIDSARIGALSVDSLKANTINAIQAYIDDLSAGSGSFQDLLTDALTARLINANNIKITSAAGNGGSNDALLTIDQAGMTIQSKSIGDSTTKVMALTKDGLYISNNGAGIRDVNGNIITGNLALKIDGERLYIDNADINNVSANKIIAGDILASNSIRYVASAGSSTGNAMIIDNNGMSIMDNPAIPTKWVKINKDGISISTDGNIWSTKLDGNKLYIAEAEIPLITANKIYTGTLNANNVTISGGDIVFNSQGITINGSLGAGLTIVTTDNKTITLDKDGLISDNFKILSDGDVQVTGTIQSTAGYFGASTDGVSITSQGLDIIGNGIVKNNNSAITANAFIVYDGASNIEMVIGAYAADKYGMYADNGNLIIDKNGLSISGGNSSIQLGADGDTYKFRALSDGSVYATNAHISGEIIATNGYFGDIVDGVQISDSGLLVIGNGSIKNSSNTFTLNSDGITATKGSIGSVTLDSLGLHAPNLLDFLSTGISVTGNRAITINNGSMVVTNNSIDYLTIGKLGASSYGLRLNIPTKTTAIYLNESGFKIEKDLTHQTFNADTDGNVTITGDINAISGTFSGVTVNGNMSITSGGTITAGDSTLSNLGLTINGTGSSINLGTGKFSVTSGGVLTAVSGKIGNIVIGTHSLTTGLIAINDNGTINISTALTLGLYDGSTYGLKINGINPIYINTNGISSPNFNIDTTTGNVNITGDINATSGNFANINIIGDLTTTTGKIKAGSTVLDKNGLYMGQGAIELGSNFSVTNEGLLTAKSGNIGGVTINDTTLNAGKVQLSSNGISIKDATDYNVISLGEYSTGKYGLSVNAVNTKITLDKNGLSAIYTNPLNQVVNTLFNINTDGSLSVIGNITATSGTFTGTIQSDAGYFGNNKVAINANGLTVSAGGVIQSGNTRLESTGIIIGSGGSINLNNNFIADDNGVQAVAGRIGGWTLDRYTISSNGSIIGLDSQNQIITIGADVVIGKYSEITDISTIDYNGVKINNITLDSRGLLAKDTTNNTKFSIGTDGNVVLDGSIKSTNGSIGGWKITTSGLLKEDELNKTIIDINSSDEIINVRDIIKIGKYDGTNYGLNIYGVHPITINNTGLLSNNFNIDTGTGNVSIMGEINATSGNFSNVNITGSITATTGSIKAGSTTLDSNGLNMKQGSIILGTDKFSVTNNGYLKAVSGIIGDVTISGEALTAGKVQLSSSGVFIKDNTNYNVVSLGEYVNGQYGLSVNAMNTRIILDKQGLSAVYTDPISSEKTTLFYIGTSGNLSLVGSVVATDGCFSGTIHAADGDFGGGKIEINSTGLTVATGGIITSGNTKLESTGITIGSGGNINLNNKFIANDNGITAIAGHIGGWEIDGDSLSSIDSAIVLNAMDKVITVGSNMSLGKYSETINSSTTDYNGLKINNITFDARGLLARDISNNTNFSIDTNGNVALSGTVQAVNGKIGGWVINSNGLIKKDNSNNTIIDINSDTEIINIKDIVKLGKYNGVDYGLQLGSAIEFNTTNGFKSTNFQIANNGDVTINGTLKSNYGYFGTDLSNGVTIGSTGLQVVGCGIIKAGNTTISQTGINIGKDSIINLNNNFIASNSGITAIAGSIAGWNINSNNIFSGTDILTSNFKLDSFNEILNIGNSEVKLGKYDGVNYGLQLGDNITFNNTYGLVISDDTLTPKFSADTDGNMYLAGTISSASGDIGGWKIGANGIYKNDKSNSTIIDINSTNEYIAIKDIIKLGKYDGTNYGLKLGNNITFNPTTGLQSTNFSIATNGDAVFNGKVTSASGYFGTTSNGVNISTTGLSINGTGLIKNNNTEISKDNITVKNGATSVLIFGQYDTNKYGIANADKTLVLDNNGLTVTSSSSSIKLGAFNVTTQKYPFEALADGSLYAANCNISGAVSALSGQFGNMSNHISISTTGLGIGTGEIYSDDRLLVLNSNGIIAQSGKIGNINIGTNALTAGSVVIRDSGKIEIGTSLVLGLYDASNYGLQLTTVNGKTVTFNSSGLIANNGTDDTFKIDSNGNLAIKGFVNATSGSFTGSLYSASGYFGDVSNNVTINSTGLNIVGNGKISIADNGVILSNTGLIMSKGSISLGNKFSVDNNGNLSALSATFGTVIVDSEGIHAGSTKLTSDGLEISGEHSAVINDGSLEVKNSSGYGIIEIGKNIVNNNIDYSIIVHGAETTDTNYTAKVTSLYNSEQAFSYKAQSSDRTKLKHMKLLMVV